AAAASAPVDTSATTATTATTTALAPIVVVGTTPLLGIGTPLSLVPANVQTVTAQDLQRQRRTTLAEYFARNLPGVDIADAQGNPFQVNLT
ncbi:TonB-dependent receptor plug domain-containing protein, partial [Staphylococcus arlettae]|uniref:TonB-dependent receptor plug domain-containing protein n=1 Tax=Staphylococcus arlettae TaxID=29378 RepID=UPI003CFAE015